MSTRLKIRYIFVRRVAGYFYEFLVYLKLLFSSKNHPQKRFVIFSSGRSGSTLLVSLLNSNPNIFCDGEILSRRVFDQKRVIHSKEKMSSKMVYGFKFLTYQLQFTQKIDNPKEFMEHLHEDGFKIIYLFRRNIFRQALSIMYAEFRNTWHHKSGKKNNHQNGEMDKMTVDTERLVEIMEKLEKSAVDEADFLSNIPHIKITYEDDLEKSEDHPNTMKTLMEFLSEDYYEPSTNLMKISNNDLSTFIQNHQEITENLTHTRFNQYL